MVPHVNRSRFRRAWPFAAVSLLAACLALRVLSDFAWLFALALIAMTLFAAAHVYRESPTSGVFDSH
ncbi:MAG: hypothetical protein QOE58_3629 [Actinomycetota bacterium]|jgi:hypothetical protein|nr:hypothetical protein [Actinomycetota bacterium]